MKWTSATQWLGRRVVVTGASGFLGGAVCGLLRELGAEVHGTWRSRSIPSELVTVDWPATLPQDAAELLGRIRPDCVIHLAAPVDLRRDDSVYNVLRVGVLDASRAVAAACEAQGLRLVHVGTCDEVACAPAPMNEDALVATNSPYGALKAAAGEYVRMRGRVGSLRAVVLRVFRAYGPGGRTGLVPAACRAALAGRALPTTDGLQVREWNHVHDLARDIVALAAHPEATGRLLHVGGGPRLAVGDLAERIFTLAGEPAELVRRGELPRRVGEVDALYTDAVAVEALLGPRPRVGLEEGLVDTLAWHRAGAADA